MDNTPTDELIRDLARFEDRIAVLKGMTPDDRAAIVADAPMNDPEAELMGCEGATLAIEDVLEARGIKPSQVLAEYRAGNLSQHQADAYDADQVQQSEAYRDGYEAWTGPGDEQGNPHSGRCTSTGDEAACESAADWDAGHAASQADYHEQGRP